MLTNTFLFKPKPLPGISKDEDHLYKIIEVLGPISKEYALSGTHSSEFFNKKGKLLNGHPKEHIRLNQLLHEDFGYSLQDSVEIEQFLLPML
jgi:serine/threonine-protein kinase SRPK3